jgi:predicted XRE-type DNA-binding protein
MTKNQQTPFVDIVRGHTREYMDRHNLSQRRMAKLVGTNQTSIRLFVNGTKFLNEKNFNSLMAILRKAGVMLAMK